MCHIVSVQSDHQLQFTLSIENHAKFLKFLEIDIAALQLQAFVHNLHNSSCYGVALFQEKNPVHICMTQLDRRYSTNVHGILKLFFMYLAKAC